MKQLTGARDRREVSALARSSRPRGESVSSSPRPDAFELQRLVGNAATGRLLRSLQRQPSAPTVQVGGSPGNSPAASPGPGGASASAAKTGPIPVSFPRTPPTSSIPFTSATGPVGNSKVSVTGRLSGKGQATINGETIPAPPASLSPKRRRTWKSDWTKDRFRTLVATEIASTAPTANGNTAAFTLGGVDLSVDLAGLPDTSAFQVSGSFPAASINLRLATSELTKGTVGLDATVAVEPDPKAISAGATSPSAQPVPGAVSSNSVPAFRFGARNASFSDTPITNPSSSGPFTKRTASVVSKATLDAFGAALRPEVKAHKFMQRPEQWAAALQEMRPYFHTDRATIDHFAKLRKANVKGSATILHEEAADRLEHVQADVGVQNMPSSGGVGWPRSESTHGGKQTLGNLHNVGFAVDYNAIQTPNLDPDKAPRQFDLVSVVTKRDPLMHLNNPKKLELLKAMGDATMSGDPAVVATVFGRPDVIAFVDQVRSESVALGAASDSLRSSLGSAATDLPSLRNRYHAAKTADERSQVTQLAAAAVAPWIVTIDADRNRMVAEIQNLGMNPGSLPTGEARKSAATEAESQLGQLSSVDPGSNPLNRRSRPKVESALVGLERQKISVLSNEDLVGKVNEVVSSLDTATAAKADPTKEAEMLKRSKNWHGLLDSIAASKNGASKSQRSQLIGILSIAAAERLRGLDPSQLIGEFRTSSTTVGNQVKALRKKAWLDRLDTLRASLLGDPDFLFGSPDDTAVAPSVGQMMEQGFHTLKPSSGKAEAFDTEFVVSMVKHGFHPGATFGDSMHFELRWTMP